VNPTRRDISPRTRNKVACVIGRAAQLIRLRGWCIGALRDDSGRVCLMGAIRETSKPYATKIRFTAYDVVNQKLRRQNADIHSWNDQQTSSDRVSDLLESVAKELDPHYTLEAICIHGLPMDSRCYACFSEAY